ncbi:hypothetical protein CEXT_790171 [Caerostris extrusa]|uniref:Uncharacterized protein n=1 Tax=Caerostris extrusa TaxID=172846 RepID=A0AAV4TLP0_CAEEX|nr:hypothetical protein CEXT_790171 [Caerostris extrusa]
MLVITFLKKKKRRKNRISHLDRKTEGRTPEKINFCRAMPIPSRRDLSGSCRRLAADEGLAEVNAAEREAPSIQRD